MDKRDLLLGPKSEKFSGSFKASLSVRLSQRSRSHPRPTLVQCALRYHHHETRQPKYPRSIGNFPCALFRHLEALSRICCLV